MRLLFCNYEYPPIGGGGGVVNAMLAEELAKRHDVTVLTSRAGELAADEIVNGVRVMRVPVLFRRQMAAANLPSMLAYLPAGIWRGRRHIKNSAYDLINTHFVLPSGPVGDALSRTADIPNVLTVHGGDLFDPSKWTSPHRHLFLRTWIRRLLRRADRLVGQSRNTLENVRRYYDSDLEGVRIPLGIARPAPGKASRAAMGIADDEKILITVGRLVARKAVDRLLYALQQLHDEQVRLLIIGTGPLQRELQTQAEHLGLAERAVFLGNVAEDEKFRLLRMADIFVSTSQHEGFGLVFVEAMACGLPVVCYDKGGQTDFLVDGKTGFLPALNDGSAFVSACRKLIRNPDLRADISTCNLGAVEELLIDHCALQYEELFAQTLAGHR